MAQRRSPARLIIALSIAGVLALFLVYVAIAGRGTLQVEPSELNARTGEVVLVGTVVPGSIRELEPEGRRFRLRDIEGAATVTVVYRDSPPDQFKADRDLSLRGRLRGAVFVGEPGTMITKCPSKYQAKKPSRDT